MPGAPYGTQSGLPALRWATSAREREGLSWQDWSQRLTRYFRHVERRPHEVDRRRTDLHITDSGRSEIVGHLMPMFSALHHHDSSFTEEEKAVVRRYLRGATEAFERVLDD